MRFWSFFAHQKEHALKFNDAFEAAKILEHDDIEKTEELVVALASRVARGVEFHSVATCVLLYTVKSTPECPHTHCAREHA